jgi:hypothetical protein
MNKRSARFVLIPGLALVAQVGSLGLPTTARAHHLAPTGLTVTGKTHDQVALNWDDYLRGPRVLNQYRVRVYSTSRVLLSTRPTGSKSSDYVVTGLSPSTTYSFRVAVQFSGGHVSKYSSQVSATTLASASDRDPPETTITGGPSGTTTQTDASFTFASDEAGSTFQCAFSGATGNSTWSSCISPKSYSGLAAGTHHFEVRATDQAGNTDATPAQLSWTVESSSGDWVFCANEHERCNFTGTREVRYGANGTFTAPRQFTDGVNCNNTVFGDPVFGVTKHCETGAVQPPPPSRFPASYFSGPLGANNVLPATTGGALISVWAGYTGCVPQCKIDRLTTLQNAARRRLDLVGAHYSGGGTFHGQTQCAFVNDEVVVDWAIQNGSVPYLSWTPDRWSGNGDSAVRQIANGNRDACIDAIANQLKVKNSRIMLRIFHEYDGHWTFGIGGGYFTRADGSRDYATDQDAANGFISAFRHIVNRFDAAGADNVGFIWCPEEGGGSRSFTGLSYPGNAYVDWTCSDRYNAAGSYWSACNLQGWADFWRIFNHPASDCAGNQNYHDRFAVANGKPHFIGETSTRYDSAMPDRKNRWYANIRLAKEPTDTVRFMSNLIGVSIFDMYVTAETNSDWRLDSNQTAAMQSTGTLGTRDPAYGLNGWVQWVNDPRWNSGVR